MDCVRSDSVGFDVEKNLSRNITEFRKILVAFHPIHFEKVADWPDQSGKGVNQVGVSDISPNPQSASIQYAIGCFDEARVITPEVQLASVLAPMQI